MENDQNKNYSLYNTIQSSEFLSTLFYYKHIQEENNLINSRKEIFKCTLDTYQAFELVKTCRNSKYSRKDELKNYYGNYL